MQRLTKYWTFFGWTPHGSTIILLLPCTFNNVSNFVSNLAATDRRQDILRQKYVRLIWTKFYFLRVVLNFGYNYKKFNKTATCQFILKFVCLIQLLFCTKNVEKRSLFILLVIWYIHSINNSAKKIHGMLKLHKTQKAYFDTDVWFCLLINSLQ